LKGRTWVILLGIAVGTAFASYAMAKKEKKNKQNLAGNDEVKNEVNSGEKGKIKNLAEDESFFFI